MDNPMLFFLPFAFFGLICAYCFYSMMAITAIEYKDDGYYFGLNSLNFISDFRSFTKQLKDQKKIKKHNRLFYGFIISAIMTFISMFGFPLLMILLGN